MYYLFLIASKVVSGLSRPAAYGVAKFFAVLYFYLSRPDRNKVIYNLTPLVEDQSKVREKAKEVFINFSYYLVDFFQHPKLGKDFIKKYVKISGLDNLDKCLAKGRGAIALTAHLGNYELAAAVTALLGYPLSVIALPHKDKRLNDFFNRRRNFAGTKVIPTGRTIKGCISALRKGELLALLGDRDFSGKGAKLSMFSKTANIPRGAAFFSLKTGAGIIPSFLTRQGKYSYSLIFEEPIMPEPESRQEDLIKRYLSVLEKYLKKYPNQWYMFERYWL